MNLNKAIELLYEYRHIDDHLDIDEINKSLDLSIEALKRLRANRDYGPMTGTGPLPSETEK